MGKSIPPLSGNNNNNKIKKTSNYDLEHLKKIISNSDIRNRHRILTCTFENTVSQEHNYICEIHTCISDKTEEENMLRHK